MRCRLACVRVCTRHVGVKKAITFTKGVGVSAAIDAGPAWSFEVILGSEDPMRHKRIAPAAEGHWNMAWATPAAGYESKATRTDQGVRWRCQPNGTGMPRKVKE